jgi:hypothetical protein
MGRPPGMSCQWANLVPEEVGGYVNWGGSGMKRGWNSVGNS